MENLFTELADRRMHGLLAALNEGLPARERYAPLFALHDGGNIVYAACNGRDVLFNAATDTGGHPPGFCACWRSAGHMEAETGVPFSRLARAGAVRIKSWELRIKGV